MFFIIFVIAYLQYIYYNKKQEILQDQKVKEQTHYGI